MKMNLKKHLKLKICVTLLFLLIIIAKIEVDYNPAVRVLLSVVTFSEKTLQNPNYLAYNIDLMDFFQNYANADVDYFGNMYLKKVKGFPYSVSGNISGKRSCDQKKFSCESDMNVLVLKVGELDAYADNDTVYVVAPMLGDIAYGFDTNENLFVKGPDFSNDLDREWIHDNAANIFHFINSIEIVDAKDSYTDDSGKTSEGYDLIIPAGEGDFIWELLGMDAPTKDIKCTLYLDDHLCATKIVFDLSNKNEGSTLTISGDSLSTATLYIPLPDNEAATVVVKRDGSVKYTNAFTNHVEYNNNIGHTYTADFDVMMNFVDDGMKTDVQNVVFQKDSEVVLEGYCNARIKKEDNMDDVFKNVDTDFSQVEVIDWATIKNDIAPFVDDVINQAKKNTDIFDFLD